MFLILLGCNGNAIESKGNDTNKDKSEMKNNIDMRELYRGNAMLVSQTESEIVVENISKSAIALRISWDNKDPSGTGKGEDPFINNWVTPGMRINRELKNHASAQVWAWGTSGELIDSCNLTIDRP